MLRRHKCIYICMCVYVCVCVCVYAHMCAYIWTYLHAYVHLRAYMCIYEWYIIKFIIFNFDLVSFKPVSNWWCFLIIFISFLDNFSKYLLKNYVGNIAEWCICLEFYFEHRGFATACGRVKLAVFKNILATNFPSDAFVSVECL